MCGIAGVVAWDEKYRVTRAQLQRMSDALAHRGPDDEGHFLNFEEGQISPDNPQCGFAFRRLAIIDPDPRSNQPFTIGHLTLVFNGEIYNYRELRSEISNLLPDYAWRTQGDTEVLLMSYSVWGERCVDHLNGMFAFAVWDDQNKQLFLARDRMGQKPLYFVSGWPDVPRIAFASEMAVIRAFTSCRPDAGWLRVYLEDGSFHEAMPYFADQVWPGQTRTCRFGSDHLSAAHDGEANDWIVNQRYFRDDGSTPVQRTPAVARVLLEQAVRRQLVADVPLGVLLSGGIDSSVVALCARANGLVKTFSIGFDDARYDESGFARAVAAHLGTEHHEFRVTPNVIEDLPKLASAFGVPFADSSAIPTHYLARETRKHVEVALSGDGGDELFGGYDRYIAMAMGARSRVLAPLRPLGRVLARGHPKATLTRAGRLLQSAGMSDAERYWSYVRLFDEETVRALLNEGPPPKSPLTEEIYYRFIRRGKGAVESALAYDRHTYLPNDLLTKLDRASMLHNLEVRSPFMDHELVQFAAGLTTDQLLKGGPKRMLREAFAKDLPDFVFKRPKMGFAVPIGEWFRGPLRGMLRDNLFAADSFGRQHFNMKVVERLVDEHESQRVDHSQRLYALLMLELWWRWHRGAG
jgi:asparagine synthase (glutamine-hydrolysing)